MPQDAEFLLIGGTGFIGKALQDAILMNKYPVVVTGRVENTEIRPGVEFTRFDMSEKRFESLGSFIKANSIIIILSPINAQVDKATDSRNFFDDVSSLHAFLDWLTTKKFGKIIFVSSGGGIYGSVPEVMPIHEDQVCNPISLNGYKKKLQETTVCYFRQTRNANIVIIRPSNPYGPDQQPFRGQGIISTLIASARDSKPFDLLGPDIVRDYIYADDLAEGVFRVAINANRFPVYNIGFGKGLSNCEVLNAILALCKEKHRTLDYRIHPPRPQDVLYNVLDIEHMKAEYNWSPKVSFSVGLRRTWERLIGR